MSLAISASLSACSSSSTTTDTPPPDAGNDASSAGGTDGGAADGGGGVCTSGTTWTQGTAGNDLMQPGNTCITCHESSGGAAPKFTVAGTVYPTRHETTLCNGLSGATVTITDANGKTATLTTNEAGNFACGPLARGAFPACDLTLPISARIVTSDGKTASMIDPQTTGDCNSCHTEQGANNAPGRIAGD